LELLEKVGQHLKDKGLSYAIEQFKRILEEAGILIIAPAVGENFDERIHEAADVVQGGKEGEIAELITCGYSWKDGKLIRPAKVKVYGKTEKKEELEKEMMRGDYV